MTVTLLTEQLEFLSLKGSCTYLSKYIHVKMPHWNRKHTQINIIKPYVSVTFVTVAVRFICLRFSLRFFSASWAAISYDVCVYIANDHLTMSVGGKLGQKPYRDLADIVRQPQGYRTIIVLSSWPPYINRMTPVRWPCGSRKESVRWLCNFRVIMCMDLNGYPCSFLHSIWTVF